ncbi:MULTISPECIES: protein adenylyltransferase SelO [Priestia]|uniref:protein adenylyltransferase SelO n=1 Tax=Priestia TaxID=2800373 RepID=UPI001454F3F3|nr:MULTISPECIES: YdiU family protein [Priestia]MBY0007484.1 YdiU family protein [Priestia aryabhattai]MBY0045009.1 YdiU family protein [Priestia aryabhattai]NLR42687.1 YdiU family protein [Priestia megaterium]WDC89953.1 YdiU family protein [Priestia megaterium]
MTNQKETGWNLRNSYAELPNIFFTPLDPNPVSSPKIVKFNDSLAASLGLQKEQLQSQEGVSILAGNSVPKGAFPLAQAYAGHQFGHFNMLGDGRAMLIGEQVTPSGERVDLQLKGSGRTPYSRGGDGRAALGPMLREYMISEAMQALGVPTTRSLAVVTTGESIVREKELPGAILTRVASSHLRFGTFQFAAKWGTVENLQALADYALERHFSHIEKNEKKYLSFLQEVIKRHATLVAKWQLIGFIHGVMNTDNMTISGETIDYGPCAFMDTYDPETVFSSIDVQGRYAYQNQPGITGWNLARFAEALLPLLDQDIEKAVEIAQNAVTEFPKLYRENWLAGMQAKLGLFNEEKEDEALFQELLTMMKTYKADYTNTFRALTFNKPGKSDLFESEEFAQWQELWQKRLGRQKQSKAESEELMKHNNPAVIPRNHRVEAALDVAQKGDYSVMEDLLEVLSSPYESPDQSEYCTPSAPSNQPYQTYCGT